MGPSEGHGHQPVCSQRDLAYLCAHRKVTDWRLIFGAKEVEWGTNKPVKPPLQERYVEKIIIHEFPRHAGWLAGDSYKRLVSTAGQTPSTWS